MHCELSAVQRLESGVHFHFVVLAESAESGRYAGPSKRKVALGCTVRSTVVELQGEWMR